MHETLQDSLFHSSLNEEQNKMSVYALKTLLFVCYILKAKVYHEICIIHFLKFHDW